MAFIARINKTRFAAALQQDDQHRDKNLIKEYMGTLGYAFLAHHWLANNIAKLQKVFQDSSEDILKRLEDLARQSLKDSLITDVDDELEAILEKIAEGKDISTAWKAGKVIRSQYNALLPVLCFLDINDYVLPLKDVLNKIDTNKGSFHAFIQDVLEETTIPALEQYLSSQLAPDIKTQLGNLINELKKQKDDFNDEPLVNLVSIVNMLIAKTKMLPSLQGHLTVIRSLLPAKEVARGKDQIKNSISDVLSAQNFQLLVETRIKGLEKERQDEYDRDYERGHQYNRIKGKSIKDLEVGRNFKASQKLKNYIFEYFQQYYLSNAGSNHFTMVCQLVNLLLGDQVCVWCAEAYDEKNPNSVLITIKTNYFSFSKLDQGAENKIVSDRPLASINTILKLTDLNPDIESYADINVELIDCFLEIHDKNLANELQERFLKSAIKKIHTNRAFWQQERDAIDKLVNKTGSKTIDDSNLTLEVILAYACSDVASFNRIFSSEKAWQILFSNPYAYGDIKTIYEHHEKNVAHLEGFDRLKKYLDNVDAVRNVMSPWLTLENDNRRNQAALFKVKREIKTLEEKIKNNHGAEVTALQDQLNNFKAQQEKLAIAQKEISSTARSERSKVVSFLTKALAANDKNMLAFAAIGSLNAENAVLIIKYPEIAGHLSSQQLTMLAVKQWFIEPTKGINGYELNDLEDRNAEAAKQISSILLDPPVIGNFGNLWKTFINFWRHPSHHLSQEQLLIISRSNPFLWKLNGVFGASPHWFARTWFGRTRLGQMFYGRSYRDSFTGDSLVKLVFEPNNKELSDNVIEVLKQDKKLMKRFFASSQLKNVSQDKLTLFYNECDSAELQEKLLKVVNLEIKKESSFSGGSNVKESMERKIAVSNEIPENWASKSGIDLAQDYSNNSPLCRSIIESHDVLIKKMLSLETIKAKGESGPDILLHIYEVTTSQAIREAILEDNVLNTLFLTANALNIIAALQADNTRRSRFSIKLLSLYETMQTVKSMVDTHPQLLAEVFIAAKDKPELREKISGQLRGDVLKACTDSQLAEIYSLELASPGRFSSTIVQEIQNTPELRRKIPNGADKKLLAVQSDEFLSPLSTNNQAKEDATNKIGSALPIEEISPTPSKK